MVKTRSKGNKGDNKSPLRNLRSNSKGSNSKGSNSNKKSSVSSSNTITSSPLSGTTTTTTSPSTKKNNPTSNSMKSVSGGSGSSAKYPKKKLKGKDKAQEENENTEMCKRNLSLSSPLNEKEEGSSAKRRRVLMNANAYKGRFMPLTKINKPSPTVEKAEAVEAPADGFVIAQVNTDLIVDAPVEKEKASCMSECEILSAPPCKANDPPATGSTAEREVDLEVAAIARDDAIDISEHLAGEKYFVPNTCLAKNQEFYWLCRCCEAKNCKRTYHLSCLDPPLQSNPPGTWLCVTCIQKRIQFGVYSLCGGIENIWDVKDGTKDRKLYLVKYKNLAHVHNRWVPETEIAVEAPELLSKFNGRMHRDKKSLPKWKQEWTVPQWLLTKHCLMPENTAVEFYDGPGDNLPYCNAEFLVKWRDLGYEHATWELENSPFLCTEESASLIKSFESRRQQARLSSYPQRFNKALEVKQSTFEKLDKLPDFFPQGLNSEHLHSVNQLRLFWHNSQNAVFIDEQERVIKTILFIMLVIEEICRPIVIISSVSSLLLWESKFQHLAPNINVVSYTGTKLVRKLMRDFELYESGCVMFQVLLSHPDAIVEDFEMLDSIGWEAVIVDECQNSRISKYLEKFKNLSCDVRLLLLRSPLRDNLSEYVNMLSYLDPNHGISNSNLSKSDMLAHFKEKLGHHLAYERKDETSKVMEYWVPAWFSKVQLELYCSTLLSNYFALRSSSRNDQVGALRDMLISLRKCCDHPYLVNQDLQVALRKERPLSEILNIDVYASGKMLLLDKLLHGMKVRGLQVLIVFQSGSGSGRNQIGDFLNDFLRQRFGAEAYEHVERGLLMSKKQIAMNNFNDKSKGRFVFLIENRACQPSLKLSAVDAVLIYDSDWNPMNDTRNLQRINIQPEKVPVFRFYSPCAVEEKVLSLAKQDVFLDRTLQGVVPTVSHSLLSWGAERLFSQLHDLHLQPDDTLDNYRSSYVSPEYMAFLDAVMTEIMDKVSGKSSGGAKSAASLLVEAQPSGKFYSHDSGPLIGEKQGVVSLHGDPPVFWSGLLEGMNPQWRFIQADGPLQRNRRKVRPFDNSEKPLVAGPSGGGDTEESRKKKKKNGGDAGMAGTGIVYPQGKTGMNVSARNSSGAVSTLDDFSGISAGPSQQEISNQAAAFASVEVGANLRGMQKDLHLLLEPQLLSLCQSETQCVAESTPPDEAVESTPPVEAAESTPPAEAAESTPPVEAAESTPPAEAAESTPPAEAAELTPSLTAVTLPAVVDVAVANGDTTTAYTSYALLFPQQSQGTVPQNHVSLPVPVPFQNEQININNCVGNGHGTSIETGTTVGVRSDANSNAQWQMLPLASPTVFPHGLHADLLKNELARIKHQENILERRDKARRMQTEMLMEEEMEALNRKYEEMEREYENMFRHQKQQLEVVYKIILLNQSLAEEFRAKITEHSTVPSASHSTSASSHLRNHVTGQRLQLLLQHRGPQQIQSAPSPAAAAPWQGSVSVNANGSLGPPSAATLHIPSISSPLRPSTACPNPNRASFSPVTLPPRPGPPLRTASAPHLACAWPHMSATFPGSASILPPGSVAFSPMQQLQSLLARSQEAPPAQTQTQNFLMESLTPSLREGPAAVSPTQNQNQPVESMLESFGNGSGFRSGQVVVVDGVVYLSDDD